MEKLELPDPSQSLVTQGDEIESSQMSASEKWNDSGTSSDSKRIVRKQDSLEELLRARKEDPEAILLALGFGGPINDDPLARIPARFLTSPSQAQGVDLNEFLERSLLSRGLSSYSPSSYQYNSLEGHSMSSSKIPPARFTGPSVPLTVEALRNWRRRSSSSASRHRANSFHNSDANNNSTTNGVTSGSDGGEEVGSGRGSFGDDDNELDLPTITTTFHDMSRTSRSGSAQSESILNPANREFLENQGKQSSGAGKKMLILGQKRYTFDDCDEDPLIIKTATPSPLNSERPDYELAKSLNPEALQAAIQQLSMTYNQISVSLPVTGSDAVTVTATSDETRAPIGDESQPATISSPASDEAKTVTSTPTRGPIPPRLKPLVKRVSFSADIDQKEAAASDTSLENRVLSDNQGNEEHPFPENDPFEPKLPALDSRDSCYMSDGSESEQRDESLVDSSLSMAINSLKLALEYYKQQSLKLATASLRRYQDSLMIMTREDFHSLRRINELRESIHQDLISMQIKLHHQLKGLQETTPPASPNHPPHYQHDTERNGEFKRIRNRDKMISDALSFAEQVRKASANLEKLLSMSASTPTSTPSATSPQ